MLNFSCKILQSTGEKIENLVLQHLLAATCQHKLLVLRGYNQLSGEALKDWCQSQVDLLHWDFGPVMELKVEKDARNYLFTERDVPLHWDGAFYQEPRYLFFHCLKAPEPKAGGETFFVNTEWVWQNASSTLQKSWQEKKLYLKTEKLAHYGGKVTIPLIQKHPSTQQTIIRFAEPVDASYPNPVQVEFLNHSSIESLQIISHLRQIMRHKEVCYTHQWQDGDYLIADNFSLLHGRNAFTTASPRHLRRMQFL